MREFEFIGYDGKWPALCGGTLTVKIDGKVVSAADCLVSGGDYNWREESTTKGPWMVDFLQLGVRLTQAEQQLLTDLVNANVPPGCCGGCI